MSDLLELAARCEAAEESNCALWWEAFKAVHGERPDFGSESWGAWSPAATRFARLLDAAAFLDAAMMLVPEGWDHIEVYRPDYQTLGWTVHFLGHGNGPKFEGSGFARTYPLALRAAALKARAAQ